MKNTFIFYLCLFCINTPSFGQDAVFSDYFASPMQISPALTGVMEGNDRVSLTHRNQYASILGANAYQTTALTYDRRWCGGLPVSTGIRFQRDIAGQKKFRRDEIYFSASFFQKIITNGTYLIAGAEAGWLQSGIDLNGLTFNAQFDGRDFDTSDFNGETLLSENAVMWDLGAGLSLLEIRESSYFIIGAALRHINRPRYTFAENTVGADLNAVIPMRLTLHASAHLRKNGNSKLGVSPRVIFQKQNRQWQLLTGLDFDYTASLQSNFPLGWGLAWRTGGRYTGIMPHSDALVISARLGLGQGTAAAVSYDLNISDLRSVSAGWGALEVTFTHQFTRYKRKNFRYKSTKDDGCIPCRNAFWFGRKNF